MQRSQMILGVLFLLAHTREHWRDANAEGTSRSLFLLQTIQVTSILLLRFETYIIFFRFGSPTSILNTSQIDMNVPWIIIQLESEVINIY